MSERNDIEALAQALEVQRQSIDILEEMFGDALLSHGRRIEAVENSIASVLSMLKTASENIKLHRQVIERLQSNVNQLQQIILVELDPAKKADDMVGGL